MVLTPNTALPQPTDGRLEYLAALWARQTGRTIVIVSRSSR
jgi:hypothetical protein